MFSILNVYKWSLVFAIFTATLSHCSSTDTVKPVHHDEVSSSSAISQPPVEPIIRREDSTVYIEMTAQVTDVEISEGVIYNAWTFNGTVPGPVLRVTEGDTLVFTLKIKIPAYLTLWIFTLYMLLQVANLLMLCQARKVHSLIQPPHLVYSCITVEPNRSLPISQTGCTA